MATLTTHVLNIANGIPAAGMRIDLQCPSSDPTCVPRSFRTNDDGRCPPLLEGAAFAAGLYSLTFHVAAYFRALGEQLPNPPFLDEVIVAFGIADAARSHHVPLLVSPWSYSVYRGS